MTIEIVKRGIKPEDRKVKGTCSNCNSELSWVAKDGQCHGNPTGKGWNTVDCPVCEHPVIGVYI